MSKGGGFRGNRGSRGGGERGHGNGGRGSASVRFPSDHSSRSSGRRSDGAFKMRFPSDSNMSDPQAYSVNRDERGSVGQSKREDSTSRGNSNRNGRPKDGSAEAARTSGPRKQRARGGERDARSGRRDGRGNRPSSNRDRPARQGGRPSHARGRRNNARGGNGNTPSPFSMEFDAFGLFCAYHLGITSDDSYQAMKVGEVAKRFGKSTLEIEEALRSFELDPASVASSGFDMAMAKMDIQVSPPGVSKTELARGLFEEYLQARRTVRGDMAPPEPHQLTSNAAPVAIPTPESPPTT